MKNFINWLLSDNPTKQQLKNRKRCKKFFKDYFGWGDTFMEIQFFILGLGFRFSPYNGRFIHKRRPLYINISGSKAEKYYILKIL